MTLGGLAPTNEIFNVSIWFGNGKTRRLGWFPYSLYSFASDRLPTPRGGLLPPSNGANFTLATGWIGRCVSPNSVGLNNCKGKAGPHAAWRLAAAHQRRPRHARQCWIGRCAGLQHCYRLWFLRAQESGAASMSEGSLAYSSFLKVRTSLPCT